MLIYELLEKKDVKKQNYLVVGPWNHGGWSRGDGASLGKINFDNATGKEFRSQVQAPWFAYFLKDKGKLDQPEAMLFQTGSNRWDRLDQWPPKQVANRNLYFQADGKLSFEAPAAGPGRKFDSYLSDPAHPVPYRPRPIEPTYPVHSGPCG